MQFEWDERKRRENLRKHGIDFADVPQMFAAPLLEQIDDRQDYGEERWYAIGLLQQLVVVVIYVERSENKIRLISARKADSYERTRYQEYIRALGN